MTRVVDQDLFKRRVLVYGAGTSARSIANLRRSADRRGYTDTVGPAFGIATSGDCGSLE